jgi:hypothetical protein
MLKELQLGDSSMIFPLPNKRENGQTRESCTASKRNDDWTLLIHGFSTQLRIRKFLENISVLLQVHLPGRILY